MISTDPSRVRLVAAALALGLAALAASAGPASAASPEYTNGYTLGLEAYKYGLPLVKMDQTFRIQTSVDVDNGKGDGPTNQIHNIKRLARAGDNTVVAPNNDTPYSIAWLNLSHQPMVIHIPRVNRYFVIPLYDPYTENFTNLGSVKKTKPGDYVVTGPGQHNVKIPRGTHRIKTNYDRVWIIGRTQCNGQSDIGNVNKIQNRYRITPLNQYGKHYKPTVPKNPDTTVDNVPMPSGLAFFDKLGYLLTKFPPPSADQAELDQLAQIGVGPGKRPSTDASLSADTKQGMIDAVAAAPGVIQNEVVARYVSGFAAHNGWLVSPAGRYGTDYDYRAAITQVGLGALQPAQAIYPLSQTDSTLTALNGSKSYVIHFSAGQLPPVKAFWSLTLYDSSGFFVPNPIDRYSIGDRTDLGYNPDGSLDIYVQSAQPLDPAQAKNWLPSPTGANFRLIMRLYATESSQIQGILEGSGWDPPTITYTP
jgi:hypothetical protein